MEPDLDQLVTQSVLSGSLSAQATPVSADVFLIAVPTPFQIGLDGTPQPNIDFVLDAARSIAPVLRPGNLVLLESTSPVGTTEHLAQIIAETNGLNIDQLHIAYCPERVLPGRILQELISNDRVIGETRLPLLLARPLCNLLSGQAPHHYSPYRRTGEANESFPRCEHRLR